MSSFLPLSSLQFDNALDHHLGVRVHEADFGCEHHSVHRLFCSALCFKSSKLTIDFIDSRVCHGWGGLTEPYLKNTGARNLTFPFIWAMCVFMLYSDCFYRKGWKGLIDLDLDGCPHHRIRTSTSLESSWLGLSFLRTCFA